MERFALESAERKLLTSRHEISVTYFDSLRFEVLRSDSWQLTLLLRSMQWDHVADPLDSNAVVVYGGDTITLPSGQRMSGDFLSASVRIATGSPTVISQLRVSIADSVVRIEEALVKDLIEFAGQISTPTAAHELRHLSTRARVVSSQPVSRVLQHSQRIHSQHEFNQQLRKWQSTASQSSRSRAPSSAVSLSLTSSSSSPSIDSIIFDGIDIASIHITLSVIPATSTDSALFSQYLKLTSIGVIDRFALDIPSFQLAHRTTTDELAQIFASRIKHRLLTDAVMLIADTVGGFNALLHQLGTGVGEFMTRVRSSQSLLSVIPSIASGTGKLAQRTLFGVANSFTKFAGLSTRVLLCVHPKSARRLNSLFDRVTSLLNPNEPPPERRRPPALFDDGLRWRGDPMWLTQICQALLTAQRADPSEFCTALTLCESVAGSDDVHQLLVVTRRALTLLRVRQEFDVTPELMRHLASLQQSSVSMEDADASSGVEVLRHVFWHDVESVHSIADYTEIYLTSRRHRIVRIPFVLPTHYLPADLLEPGA